MVLINFACCNSYPINIGPYVGSACLPPANKDYRGRSGCYMTGWGVVRRHPEKLADQLKKVRQRVQSHMKNVHPSICLSVGSTVTFQKFLF